jgi:hypothetical protein
VEDKSGQITQSLHRLEQGNRAVDDALRRPATFDQTQAALPELHFFGDPPFDEIAQHQSVSKRTVKGDWTTARAWLDAQFAPLK